MLFALLFNVVIPFFAIYKFAAEIKNVFITLNNIMNNIFIIILGWTGANLDGTYEV